MGIPNVEMDYYFGDTIHIEDQNKNQFENKNQNQINYSNNIDQIPSNTLSAFQFNKSKKRKPKRKKSRKNSRSDGIGYDPNSLLRAQGNIQISKSLTDNIIPSMIKENICNVYAFMDKSCALQLFRDEHKENNDLIKIFNFNFHDKETGKLLYCIVERQDMMANKSRGYKWIMINRLFSSDDIENEYGRSNQNDIDGSKSETKYN